MTLKPSPVAFIVFFLAGWISRQQVIVIEYLKAENRMLRERLKARSLRFSDRERALLARKAFGILRKTLLELGTIATPDAYVCNRRAYATWNSTKGNSQLATKMAERRLLNRK